MTEAIDSERDGAAASHVPSLPPILNALDLPNADPSSRGAEA